MVKIVDSALQPPTGPGTVLSPTLGPIQPEGTVVEPTEVDAPQTVDQTPDVEPVTPPPVESPISIVSSEEARDATTQNLQFLEDEKTAQAEREAEEAPTPEKIKEEEVPGTGLTFDEAKEIFGTDFTGVIQDPKTGLFNPDASALGRLTPEQTEAQKEQEELDKEFNTAIKEIETLRSSTRELNRQLLQGVKDRFAIRRTELKDANKRRQASLTQFGIRSGAFRRSVSFGGALSAEERAGIQSLAKLDAQESALLIEAQIAANAQDFELLSEKIGAIESKRADQVAATKELNEASIKQQELVLKQNKDARETEEALREEESFVIENTARTVLNSLTGDEETDSNIISGFAELEGVDANRLLNEILKQDATKRKEDFDLRATELGITSTILSIEGKRLDNAKKDRELRQKLSRGGFEILDTKQALTTNRNIAKTDAFKAIRKGQDSLQFLIDFEEEFINQGGDLQRFGAEAGALQTKYRAALLNLKEFFNLGVLNGPDLEILEDVLPNPANLFLATRGGGKTVSLGIASMKKQILTTVNDRALSVKNEFANFDPEQLTNLKEVDRLVELINKDIGDLGDTPDDNPDLGSGGFYGSQPTKEETDFLNSI